MPHHPARLVIIGHPVAQSLSPVIHTAALAAAGIPVRYERMDVPPGGLDDALALLRRDDAGGNVTIPHKEAMWRACNRRSPLAERVGAENTFWFEDAGTTLAGDNTDVGGIEHTVALLGGWRAGTRVALLGAGGASAGVLAAAERAGVRDVRILARTMDRALALARRFPLARAVASREEALDGADFIVNATPVGSRDDECPMPVAEIPSGARVFDLVYRRGETAWVRDARAAGHEALDGLPMLLEQAALAFERWFGIPPDRSVMAASVQG
jgi:shikimate dehydrogenase